MVSLTVILFSTKCFLFVYMYIDVLKLKGGYLDFSHLTELKKISISLKFIGNNYTNQQVVRIKKNYKKKKKKKIMVVPLRGYVAS